jgi:hypothetical protein
MMNLIGRLVVVGALSLGVIASAEATCTKPSGTYAGVFSGGYYSSSGSVLSYFATELTLVIATTGSGSFTETGKSVTATTAGRYTAAFTFTTAGNVFNTTTCQGIVTVNSGNSFIYSSTNSGSDVRLTYYNNDTNILVGVALLQKI